VQRRRAGTPAAQAAEQAAARGDATNEDDT
jgi:hypothetical protein